MWRNFIITLILTDLIRQECDSINLEIAHYRHVTLESCGLKKLRTPSQSCIKWRQTIREELAVMKSIEFGGFAETGEFPFTVMISVKSKDIPDNRCTGSIINSKWIVTAAHCLDGEEEIKVYAGFTDYPKNLSQYIGVKRLFLHHNYSLNSDYDIGLIQLEKEIEIGDNANSICLPTPKVRLETAELATFTGWGHMDWEDKNDQRLKKTQIRLTNKFAANNITITINETIDGRICKGDSGGPLFQYINGRAVLIGVVIRLDGIIGWGGMCPEAEITRFASAIHHVKWIRDTIIKNL